MTEQLEQIRPYAQPYLEDGEERAAALTAAPRGRSTAVAAGGVAGMIGQKMVSGVRARAQEAGLRVESNMAVALTQRRLLTLKVKISMRGAITGVTDVLSSVPIADVDSIEAKRFGAGGILVLSIRDAAPVQLECRVGRARALVDAFTQATAMG